MENQESQIIFYSKYFYDLEKIYNDTDKPIIVVGPINCGKLTATKQLCIQKGKIPYIDTESSNINNLLGFNDSNDEYKASPLFNAYVTGQVYYVYNAKKITKNYLETLNNIQTSKNLTFPCGKVEKGKGFRIIVSTTKLSSTIKDALKKNFAVVEFDYDIDLESLLCLDIDFYSLLLAMRKIAKKNKLDLYITTDTFVKVAKMRSVESIKELAILQSILASLNKDEIILMINELKQMNINSKYLLMLDALI